MASVKRTTPAVVWPALVLAFFLNPGFACGPADPEFQYGADEMRAAAEGTWFLSFLPAGETEARQVTVKVTQSSKRVASLTSPGRSRLIRPAHACGSRTLLKSASACGDSTLMPLDVTFVDGDASLEKAEMSGLFVVDGLTFTNTASGEISFKLGGYTVGGRITPDGTVLAPHLSTAGSTGTVTAAMRL